MGIRLITCTQCKKQSIRVHLEIRYKTTVCDHCHHLETSNISFHFCDLKCLSTWLQQNKIVEDGIDCPSCHGTGFAFGYESNGICLECDGKKKIQITINQYGSKN